MIFRIINIYIIGTRNAEGERILEFGDAVGMVDLVVCNIFFKSGDIRSMIDYLIYRKTDRCLVKDVKVILSEECVPQHRMVIGRLVIPMKIQKKKIIRFVPKPKVWKLKDKETARLFTHEMATRNDDVIKADDIREGRDVISVCCMKNNVGNVVSDADGMRNVWIKYMEKLLNVENDWDGEVDCPEVMGPRHFGRRGCSSN